MKTAILFETLDGVDLYIVEGDHSELHKAYIGSGLTSDENGAKLLDLIYSDVEEGTLHVDPLDPSQNFDRIKECDFLIVCGET